MLMLDLAKQGKQELQTLSFPSRHALRHTSNPMKGSGLKRSHFQGKGATEKRLGCRIPAWHGS